MDPQSPEAQLSYTTEVSDYVRKLGTRMFVPINGYYAYDWVPEADDHRELPIHTTLTRFMVDTVNLRLPGALEIESGLYTEEVHYTHAAGEYRARLQATQEGVPVDSQSQTRARRPAAGSLRRLPSILPRCCQGRARAVGRPGAPNEVD